LPSFANGHHSPGSDDGFIGSGRIRNTNHELIVKAGAGWKTARSMLFSFKNGREIELKPEWLLFNPS
jgi:hypothetical protein